MAADLRASTPTDAAKKVVPDVREQWQLITNAWQRMNLRMDALVGNEQRLIEGYANRPSLTNPSTMLEPHQRLVDDAVQRMRYGLTRIIDDAGMTIEKLHASLTAMSPQATLNRGYAVVQTADGHVLDNAADASMGEQLSITPHHGTLLAEVKGQAGGNHIDTGD